jgi:ubiquinone/menaquinone biosynthesis C-methylase UbiE
MCGSKIDTHKILGKRLNCSQGKNPRGKIGITTTILKCTNCGLIYSNPQPVPFDIQDHYGVIPESYWKENYFVIDDNYFKYEITRLKSLIDFKEGMKSLDIGAGLGKQMIALGKIGFDTFGIEPSINFYERAISKMGIKPEKLILGQIEKLNFNENSFDFISFNAVLEHLYDPSGSILKALKWLKTDGIIYILVPSSDWLIGKIINLFYKLKRTDYVCNLSPMHEPYHLYEFGLKSFQYHAKRYNYDLAFYEYFVGETYMPKAFNPILVPYMKQTNTGMMMGIWLKKINI